MTTQLTTLTDTQWRATIDAEMERDEWLECMAAAQLEQSARNLGLMMAAMVGGEDYERLVDTLEYRDWQEDEAWMRGGC